MELTIVDVLLWGSLAAVAYTYFGYPFLLSIFGRTRRPAGETSATLPFVSVVIAAYNEERCIARKIENVLQHDYPPELLELLIVSDGSKDGTDEVVRECSSARLRLLVQPTRQGKNQALNRGAREARGEILVFTDADAMLVPGALAQLVRPFANPTVGLVSGQGLYGELGDGTTRVVSNAYVRYESFIKQREASMGFVAAADGALYAMRRALYEELPSNQVHDLVHPIQVAVAGGRSAFKPEAFTVELPSTDAGKEFKRHVRIIAQGFLVLLAQTPALLSRGKLKELWMLVSHRLLRWTSSLFLVCALVSNLMLLEAHPTYKWLLLGQLLFYMFALVGGLAERLQLRLRLLAVPYYFCVVSAAGAGGFVQFLRGRGHATWLPTGG